MITLLALFLRLVVLAIFTFGFVVLFEHGTKNYLDHAKSDAIVLQHWVEAKLRTGLTKSTTPEPPSTLERPSAAAPAVAPVATPASTPVTTPVATPASTPEATPGTPTMPSSAVTTPQPADAPAAAPSDWQSLQNKPIDDESTPPS